MIWTEAEDTIIRDNLHKRSARDIAALIGGGVTRNAVIGRGRRLGLSGTRRRASIKETRPRIRRTNPLVQSHLLPVPWTPQEPPVDAPPSLQVSLLEARPDQCRYMAGEDYLMCGHPVIYRLVRGEMIQSWCAHHFRLVYRAVKSR